MKRALAFSLGVLMIFMLTACSSPSNNAAAESETDTAAPASAAPSTADAPSDSVDTIKLGALYPLSGPYATSGATAKYTLDLVVDIINNEYGGIQNLGGAKIEVIYGDTQSSPEIALSEMERLIETGVDILIGGHNTPVGNTISQYAIAYDMPLMMTGSYGNDAYTTPNDVVFHAAGCTALGGVTETERNAWMTENYPAFKGGKVFAFVYAADDYGRAAYEGLVAAQEEMGVEEIIGIPIESGSTDLSSQLTKLKGRSDIEYINFNAGQSDSILFLRQCKEYEIAVPIFAGGAGFLVADFLDQVGDAGDYVFTTGTWIADYCRVTWDPDLAYEFDQKCYDALGYRTDETYAYTWEGIWSVWDVLERTASLDIQDIKAAFKATDITGEHMALLMSAHEYIRFEDGVVQNIQMYNQNMSFPGLWAMALDGEYHIVYPEKYADPNYPMVYPIPSWDER